MYYTCDFCKKTLLLTHKWYYCNKKLFCSNTCRNTVIINLNSICYSNKHCASCHNELNNNANWYCADDKIYCSKKCRLNNNLI